MTANFDLDALVDTYDIDNVYEEYKRVEFLTKLGLYFDLQKSSVLELGSASGRFTKLLVQTACEVLAVDGSTRFLEIAKRYVGKAGNVRFVQSYFEELNVDKVYNCLIMHHVLEHVTNPKQILYHLRSVLDDSGLIAVSVPNAKALSRQLAVKMGLLKSVYELTENDRHHGHVRVYDWGTLEEELLASGYAIVGRHGLSFKLFSDSQNVEMLKAKIIDESQIQGLWELGDEFKEISGAIMVVAQKNKRRFRDLTI